MTFQEVLVYHYILHRSLFIIVFATLYCNFYFHSYLLLWTEHSDGQNCVLFTLVSPILAQCLEELLFSHSVKSNSLQTHGLQHARLPYPSLSPGVAQTHVHWICDAIQPSHPLSSPFPPALHLSQHQDLFQRAGSLHQVAKVLELQLQHQSFQWIFRTDFL